MQANLEERPAALPHLLGIDLGGTKAHLAIADPDGSLVAETVVDMRTTGRHDTHGVVAEAVRNLLAGPVTLGGIGLGVAGVVGASGTGLELAPNLVGTDLARLIDELSDSGAIPVRVENDVNAAALGEWTLGHARGVPDFAFIAVGTGVGMGLIAGGALIHGSRNAAGEIGYLPLGADPYDASNQVRGPLEEVAAGPAIAARYNRCTGRALDACGVFDLLGEDPAADGSVDTAADHLAQAIVAVRSVLDPALIVLGGGVGSRPELLERVQPRLARLGAADLPIKISALGASAAVHGALHLARLGRDRSSTPGVPIPGAPVSGRLRTTAPRP